MKKRKRIVRTVLSAMTAAALAFSITGAAFADVSVSDTVTVSTYADEVTSTEPASIDGVYQITSAGELYWFAETVNAGSTSIDAVLCNDITINTDVLSEKGTLNSGSYTTWTPAGSADAPYTGTFDGAGYTISGLYYKLLTSDYLGLFGALGSGAVVKDLTITDSYIYGDAQVGSIAGYCSGATITGCLNEGSVSGVDTNVGGIVGSTEDSSTVTECENTGAVYGSQWVGGISGRNLTGSVISYCINSGTVTFERSYVAGISGLNDTDATISNCLNTGNISGYDADTAYAVCESNSGKVKSCYYVVASSGRITITDSYGLEVTSDEASGGYLCYQLNGQSSAASDVHFYQTLGEDDYPVLDSTHKKVYRVSTGVYSNTKSSSSSSGSTAAKKGTVIKKGKITYVVTSKSGQTVMVKKVAKSVKNATIPSTIKYKGITYSVTKINKNACKGNTKLKKITIGENVSVIGKQAFYGCKNLKTVIFKGRRIQKIQSKAFKGTAKKITVKATSTKIRTYQTLLKKAGISSKAKYVKT